MSLASLITEWDGFVILCENGYSFDLSEYDNDLAVRRKIKVLIEKQGSQNDPSFGTLIVALSNVDNRFRDMLLPDTFRAYAANYWWETSFLKYAGDEYVNDIKSLYGVSIPVAD